MPTASVREPAVAGMFYPGDAHALASNVDSLFAGVHVEHDGARARVMLAPHAGYIYSGAIAAHAFALLRERPPHRAFIIGPSHVEAFNFTSVFDGSAYRTPLGEVPVDEDAARALERAHASIHCARAGHVLARASRGEHAIEVELPFLQRVAADVRIVPVIMGTQSWEACAALGAALRAAVDWRHDVVIASSDLSHFYDDKRARELDGVFCETLFTMDARLLHQKLERGECEACGGGPVVAALIASEGLRARACNVLARGNSGDVSGDRSSVVGYVSAVVTGEIT